MTLYRTRMVLITRVQTGVDRYGGPIYEDVEKPFRGEFFPLSSDQQLDLGRTQVTTRFRVIFPRTIGELVPDAGFTYIKVFGKEYRVDGSLEPHTITGRIHHFEAIVERRSG